MVAGQVCWVLRTWEIVERLKNEDKKQEEEGQGLVSSYVSVETQVSKVGRVFGFVLC